MRESSFQKKLINAIKEIEPDVFVLKNDCGYLQGFPDLTVLFPNGRWALLECKISEKASHQPNQDYYISKIRENTCGYANFVSPENLGDVLSALDILSRRRC